jgi:hypothetical protein
MNVYTVQHTCGLIKHELMTTPISVPPSGRQVPQGIGSGVGLEVIRVSKLLSGTVEEEERKD